MIVSHDVFIGFITLILLASSAGWAIRDVLFLRRVRRSETDPVVRRDKTFGALAGMSIGLVGIIGVLRYHL